MLRKNARNPCHVLHYLQMATEKLAKAYFWRSGKVPAKSHVGFSKLFRALADNQSAYAALGFKRVDEYRRWCRQTASGLSHEIESLAPSLANNGPNPEYPWPHHAPTETPASFSFPLWDKLQSEGAGRQFLARVELAISSFDAYGFK